MTSLTPPPLFVLLLAAAGASSCGPSDTRCAPVEPLLQAHLTARAVDGGAAPFCFIAHAFQRQDFAVTVADGGPGYATAWTGPPGAVVLQDGLGARVFFGEASGPLCATHQNQCSGASPLTCRDVTVLTNRVWAGLPGWPADEVVYGGAAVTALDTAWVLNPRYRPGVWRLDPATQSFEKVVDEPAGLEAASGRNTGGVAATVNGVVFYLAGASVFRFDPASLDWTRIESLPFGVAFGSAGLAAGGDVFVLTNGPGPVGPGAPPRAFWRYGPAGGQVVRHADFPDAREGAVGFMWNGNIVFGGGHRCEVSNPACWAQDFYEWDEVMDTWSKAPFEAPAGTLVVAALPLPGRVELLLQGEQALVLEDGATAFAPWLPNPALGCAPVVKPQGRYLVSATAVGGRVYAVGGVEDVTGGGSIAGSAEFSVYLP